MPRSRTPRLRAGERIAMECCPAYVLPCRSVHRLPHKIAGPIPSMIRTLRCIGIAATARILMPFLLPLFLVLAESQRSQRHRGFIRFSLRTIESAAEHSVPYLNNQLHSQPLPLQVITWPNWSRRLDPCHAIHTPPTLELNLCRSNDSHRIGFPAGYQQHTERLAHRTRASKAMIHTRDRLSHP